MMKTLPSTLAVIFLLVGCASSRRADSERRLAEAQQNLDAATKALQEAQDAVKKEASPAADSAIEKAQAHVNTTAGSVENAANDTKAAAAEETDKQAAEAAHKSAAAAEAKAQEARRLAEPPKSYTVNAGTAISVRMLSTLSTKSTTTGSQFEASLTAPIKVDGYLVATNGAIVEGEVTNSDDGGRVKGRASLSVRLRRLKTADGRTINIQTQSLVHEAKSTKKKDAAKIGIGAGIGAAIGAIAGGGRGAAIGAGAGAAGGTGLTLATKGDPAVIPVETLLTFRLSAPFTIVEIKR